MNQEIPERLTPLERELLSLVEALNTAFEQTSAQLRSLEERSTRLVNEHLTRLEGSLEASLSSQTRFNAALVDWLMQPKHSTHASNELFQALEALKINSTAATSPKRQ